LINGPESRCFTDMAYLVLIRGLTGTGKSTLSEHLAARKSLCINKLEIDDIKIRKYGNTRWCIPEVDFPEAGKQAKELLKNDINVVVEEAFCTKNHIELFLRGTQMDISNPKLLVVRLECSLGTAIKRKRGQLDDQTVRGQYCRVVEDVENEIVFDTESCSIKEMANDIVKRIK
jgi:broad-specificity NMP kinase